MKNKTTEDFSSALKSNVRSNISNPKPHIHDNELFTSLIAALNKPAGRLFTINHTQDSSQVSISLPLDYKELPYTLKSEITIAPNLDPKTEVFLCVGQEKLDLSEARGYFKVFIAEATILMYHETMHFWQNK